MTVHYPFKVRLFYIYFFGLFVNWLKAACFNELIKYLNSNHNFFGLIIYST